MKRMFRYLLAFDAEDGTKTVAEFNSQHEYLSFKEELDQKGVPNRLVNEREFAGLQYKGAQYLDLRD